MEMKHTRTLGSTGKEREGDATQKKRKMALSSSGEKYCLRGGFYD